MSFSDPLPPFMPPSPSFSGDAISVWPQFPMNDQQFDQHSQFEQHSPFKKARNSEENQSNPPMNSRLHPPNAPINKGSTNIFFKTRMCAKFRVGMCRNGENCNFAHGIEDMRQPPPNWQELVTGGRDEDRPSGNWDDDQKIIHRMKLCKKFYNGEECPYGDRCNFLHEDPSKFRDDVGRYRESSAISIGTTGSSMGHESGNSCSEGNRPVTVSAGVDGFRANIRPVYWKTKFCTKWEMTGLCPFGEKCHFAHGQAELKVIAGSTEGEMLNSGPTAVKPQSVPTNDGSPSKIANMPKNEEWQDKKSLLKWKGPKKINRIYADWLDDLPLVQTAPSKAED